MTNKHIGSNFDDFLKEERITMDIVEPWINIYKSEFAVWTGRMFYKTSKRARTKLADKENYYCTINVQTGERITKKLR